MSQSASVALPGRTSMAMLPSPERARTAVSLPDILTRPSPVVASTTPSTPSSSIPPSLGDADGAVAARGPDVRGLGHRDNQSRAPGSEPAPAVSARRFNLDGHAIAVLAAL